MQGTVYLVCGVPGAGKSWVCEQLRDKFTYVVHDDHMKDHVDAVLRAAHGNSTPIVTECPFGERETRAKLAAHGLEVKPVFIVESPEVVRARYMQREGREPYQASLTRAVSIKNRAVEWNAPFGTSTQVLQLLKEKV